MKLERYALLAILGTVPIVFGAVQPWISSWYVTAVFLTFVWAWWRNEVQFRDNGVAAVWVLYFFLAWTLFQVVPLPGEWLEGLSPFRAALLENARELAGINDAWSSVAYVQGMALAQWTLWLSAFLLAMLVAAACRKRGFLTSLAVMLLVLGGLQAVYGLVQAMVPTTGVLGHTQYYLGDARGTFINRNHFAGMVEMIWPLGLGYLLSLSPWKEKPKLKHLIDSDHFNRQLLISLVLAVMVLALIFSRSRAGIVGLVLGFAAFVGAMAFSGVNLKRGFFIGTGICLALLGLYCAQIGLDNVIERFLQLEHGNSRGDIWRDAWLILLQHPLGVGPGNFQVLEPLFQANAKSVAFWVHTHNDYLQLLVETGWPGFLLLTSGWVYLLVWGLAGLRRLFKRMGYSLVFFMGAGAWSGVVSMAFHSFFDFNLQITANLFYFAMLIGILNHAVHAGKMKSVYKGEAVKGK